MGKLLGTIAAVERAVAAHLLTRTGRAAFCSCLDSAGKKHALQLKAVLRVDTAGLGSSGAPFAPAKVSWAGLVLANAAMLMMILRQGWQTQPMRVPASSSGLLTSVRFSTLAIT